MAIGAMYALFSEYHFQHRDPFFLRTTTPKMTTKLNPYSRRVASHEHNGLIFCKRFGDFRIWIHILYVLAKDFLSLPEMPQGVLEACNL